VSAPVRKSWSFRGLRARLIISFMSLAALLAVCGAINLRSLSAIRTNVATFSGVASPMLSQSMELNDSARKMHISLLEALTQNQQINYESYDNSLNVLGASSREKLNRLRALADGADLRLDFGNAATTLARFIDTAKQALAAHQSEQAALATERERFDSFDNARAKLDEKLAAIARRYEDQMTEAEDTAKIKVQIGDATVKWLGDLFNSTLNETYPGLQNAYKVMRDVVRLQEMARSFASETDESKGLAIEQSAQRTFKLATATLRRLAGRLRTAEGIANVNVMTQGIAALEASLLGADGAFAARRKTLQAAAAISALKDSLQQADDNYAAVVNSVEAAARRLHDESKANTDQGIDNGTNATFLVLVVGVIIALVLGLLLSHLLVRPIRQLTVSMQELAAGNFEIVLPGLGRNDEVGEMAEAVETFKLRVAEKARLDAENDAERARHEARRKEEQTVRETAERETQTQLAVAERSAVMHKLAGDFEAAVGQIIETVSSASLELEAAAGTLTKTADTTGRLSGLVASASQEASASVEQVSTAAGGMRHSISEIHDQVQESSKIAAVAVKQASVTDARISELSSAAGRIGDVVKLITAIAEQTNLLALNATIEAARAGDAGRGFAVVAQEVKALASQTAKATEEIGTQISGMQTATRDSVTAIKEIGGTIGRLAEIASTIAAAVQQQGDATEDISRNVDQAASAASRVASNIVDVNRGANDTGAASARVLSSAQSLASESSRLKLEVGKFLNTVRTA